MFYGEIIRPGKPVAYVPPPDDTLQLHLSSAALAADAPEGARASLMVRPGQDEEPVALCTLTAGRLDTVPLDQFLSHYAELTVVGSAPVHVTGYYAPSFDVPPGSDDEMDDGMDDDDDDDDDDDEGGLMLPGGGSSSDEDDEDEDDDDDDDEDEEDDEEDGRRRLSKKQARAMLLAAAAEEEDDEDEDDDEDDEDEDEDEEDPMLAELEEAADVVLRAHGGGVGSESEDEDEDDDSDDSDDDESDDEDDSDDEFGAPSRPRKEPSVVIEDITDVEVAAETTTVVKEAGKKEAGKGKHEQPKAPATPGGTTQQQQQQQQQQQKDKDAPASGGKKRAAAGKEEADDKAAAAAPPPAKKQAKPDDKKQAKEDGGDKAQPTAAAGKKTNVRRWENGFAIEDLSMGPPTGKVATSGRNVAVRYTGRLSTPQGKVFDSNVGKGGKPLVFRAGAGQVVPGFDRGVLGMRVGDKRRVTIPSQMGYGAQRVGSIPPNSTLVFDIELVRVD